MEQSFTRLSPRFNYSTALYHNGEYLLIIDRSFNMESYRRIYFKDIQSLQIQQTRTWLVNAVLMGGLAGIFTLFGLALWFSADASDDGIRVLAAIMLFVTLVFGAVMAKYLVLGASCKVYACTAVQRIYLPNISTMRKLKLFTDLITPLVEDAQGTFTESELSENLAEMWKSIRSERQSKGRLRRRSPAPIESASPADAPAELEYVSGNDTDVQPEAGEADVIDSTPDVLSGAGAEIMKTDEDTADSSPELIAADSQEGETDVVSS